MKGEYPLGVADRKSGGGRKYDISEISFSKISGEYLFTREDRSKILSIVLGLKVLRRLLPFFERVGLNIITSTGN
jgi:hypothetical protein